MGYTDFIRGKYPTDSPQKEQTIKLLLEEMTCGERHRLGTLPFETLWEKTWMNHASLLYFKEHDQAERKFNSLDITKLLETSECKWAETEWGFPKGKKHLDETPLKCALWEFYEESGYSPNTSGIHVFPNQVPWYEEFTGTNGIQYRHIYYIAHVNQSVGPPAIDSTNISQVGEVSNCAWVTYEQGMHLIRDYDVAKKDLLTRVHNSRLQS
ncbi:hypothetical protein HDU76_012711 [Blyttiomyces sp. JEL0837]|nr:hypothetical protein HDU76_012711 [Blyttiomyces sp. JEL0837]